MEKVTKKIRVFLGVGIALALAFVAGIPMTVLGATNGITALLAIGIIFIVAGFYVSPIMLVQVSEKRKLKRVVQAVEEQNLYTVREIAAGVGIREKAVRGYLTESLQKGYLIGYKLEGDDVVLITAPKQTLSASSIKCPSCGAQVRLDPLTGEGECGYCGWIAKQTRK